MLLFLSCRAADVEIAAARGDNTSKIMDLSREQGLDISENVSVESRSRSNDMGAGCLGMVVEGRTRD